MKASGVAVLYAREKRVSCRIADTDRGINPGAGLKAKIFGRCAVHNGTYVSNEPVDFIMAWDKNHPATPS